MSWQRKVNSLLVEPIDWDCLDFEQRSLAFDMIAKASEMSGNELFRFLFKNVSIGKEMPKS